MWSGNVWATNKLGLLGPVCDDNFNNGPDADWGSTADNNNAANVVCWQLGYNRGQALKYGQGSRHFGRITPDTFSMDDVKCTGRERCLSDCPHATQDDCTPNEGAGVICYL